MNTTGKIVFTFFALIVISGLVLGLAQCRASRASEPETAVSESPEAAAPGSSPPSAATGGGNREPAAPPADPDAEARARTLIEEARRLVGEDHLPDARAPLYEAMKIPGLSPQTAAQVKDLLGRVNVQVFFSPYLDDDKVEYFIEPGDSLGRIARKFGTTIEAIRRINGIEGDLIRPGERLRVVKGTYRIVVDCATNRLTLYVNDRWFKEYPIGTGQYDRTPIGDFKIVDKVVDPVWWKEGRTIPFGDPENILGTRWLSLDIQGFGIHGTWDESGIGRASSAGCIRMRNADVEELFDIVTAGTPVKIVGRREGG